MTNDLGALIQAEVARAESDYGGVRSKALGILGVAGGLVSLVTGFLAIAAGSEKDILPDHGDVVVAIAVGFFVLTTVIALIINFPAEVWATKASELRDLVDDHWDDDGWDQSVADFYVDYLDSLRVANRTGAQLLAAALVCEIIGIAATAALAILVVTHLGGASGPTPVPPHWDHYRPH